MYSNVQAASPGCRKNKHMFADAAMIAQAAAQRLHPREQRQSHRH
jgi:hypothetical protein